MKQKLLFFLCGVLFITGCKKNEAGGNAEIKGTVVHHAKPIPNATVYIKYDATEFPGQDLSVYDTQVSADANGDYSFKCYKGDYFLYGRGIDFINAPVEVDGGAPVSIRAREVVEAEVAVSEVH